MLHRPPLSRLLAAIGLLAAPILVILAGLVAFARLEPVAAAVAGLLLLFWLWMLLRGHLAHLGALADYAERMAAGRPGPPPAGRDSALGGGLAPRLLNAISVWREREESLVQHATEAERVLARLPDPVLLVDSQTRIRLANPAAETLFEGPLPGRNLTGILRHPELLDAVDRALDSAESETVEFTMPVPVERSFDAHVLPLSGAPQENPAGAASAGAAEAAESPTVLLALQDMTKVMRADRLRADFVANASHELRTPLATLLGFIETLRGPAKDDGEARAKFLGIMQEQASRMARLVGDLLSLSRIELNEHSVPTEGVRLHSVLASVADSLAMKAAARSMTIELPADLASLPPVQGDQDELIQLFQNLIDNALKYGRAGSPVRVLARASEPPAAMTPARPAVAVAVIDQGEGIDRRHLPRLTERFYRVDTARSRDLGGTGLGLAIVKHIVSRHRGALELESDLGQGSRFTVFLPQYEPGTGAMTAYGR
jgi:two-component system, OmpR family, phosphate regulon sensor histidine kinase PhoR